MNHEETRFAAKVMSSWADGKTVQARDKHSNNSWFDCRSDGSASMAWDWSEMDYRIKPMPMVAYVLFDSEKPIPNGTFFDEMQASDAAVRRYFPTIKIVKFIEVME